VLFLAIMGKKCIPFTPEAAMNLQRLKIDSLSPGVRSAFSRLAAPSPIPSLRLRGRWLERAGFVVGASVQVVVVSPRRLVATAASVGRRDA